SKLVSRILLGAEHGQRIVVAVDVHLLCDVLREAVLTDRIVHAAVAVYPDAVVVGADGGSVIALFPLAAHSLRIVEDLAEPQYDAGPPARAECSQTWQELGENALGNLVDHQHVRIERTQHGRHTAASDL